jgi:hypothetical protein
MPRIYEIARFATNGTKSTCVPACLRLAVKISRSIKYNSGMRWLGWSPTHVFFAVQGGISRGLHVEAVKPETHGNFLAERRCDQDMLDRAR